MSRIATCGDGRLKLCGDGRVAECADSLCPCGWVDINQQPWGTCGGATPPGALIEHAYDFTPGAISEFWVKLGGEVADCEPFATDGRYLMLGDIQSTSLNEDDTSAAEYEAFYWMPRSSVDHDGLVVPTFSVPSPPTPSNFGNGCLRRDVGELWVPLWMDGFGIDGGYVVAHSRGTGSSGGGGITLECRDCFRVAPPQRIVVAANQQCIVPPWPTGKRHISDEAWDALTAPCIATYSRGAFSPLFTFGTNKGCFREWPLAIVTEPCTLLVVFSVIRETVRRYYRSSTGLFDRDLLYRDFNPWGEWVLIDREVRDARWWDSIHGNLTNTQVIDQHPPNAGAYPGGMTKANVTEDIASIDIPTASEAAPRIVTLRYRPLAWSANVNWPDEHAAGDERRMLRSALWGLGSTCIVHEAEMI
ncbi:MAG: hypothetical protein IPM64_17180 [Phycisphaerales bacterium]|nr:hypothetical protein [Phycisphaerales bacterium]